MNRYARRLLLVILWLAVADVFVQPLLDRAEQGRYERGGPFRFENSDLFSLGPLVRYVREHPHGERPRDVFLGNSVFFGYWIDTRDALPAQFEKCVLGRRVFNAATNGQEMGDALLVGKSIIDSVDRLYVQVIPRHDGARPVLGKLLPVSGDDANRYHLEFDPLEARWRSMLARVWRLYAFNDRLQAAWFGTSTRQFLYLHKRELFSRHVVAPETPHRITPVTILAPCRAGASVDPRVISRAMVELAEIAVAHKRHVVFVHFQHPRDILHEQIIASFNARFSPYAELVSVQAPRALYFDGLHLTPDGAASVAAALAAHERLR